jgi:DNA-binding response OmpR family regulator
MEGRALVADTDVDDCQLIRDSLAAAEMDSLVVHNGMDALSRLRSEKFLLLVVDLCMPSPNGIDVTKAARTAGPNQMTPIVVISGDQDHSAVSRAFQAGANFFLYKPVEKARLMSLVRATQGNAEHEKRRFRRVSLQLKVKVDFEGKQFDGETINVSLNGLLMRTNAEIPTGSRVWVSFSLTDQGEPVVCAGTIMRALGGNRTGVLLDQLKTEDSMRLQDFLLPLILQEDSREQVLKV